MILQATELSPTQKTAIEELFGRALSDQEAVSLRAFTRQPVGTFEKEAAREKLLDFLSKTERPRPGVSEEELEAAFLESMRSVRPNYTEVS
jgi:hypothetical protein